jgi:uncharacterized RDD family membrane protein YckC
METFNLQTTQNVTLQYQIASVGDRILAAMLDYSFMAVYFILLTIILSVSAPAVKGWLTAMYVPVLFYHLFFEIFFNGQSPGKMIMGIKVVKTDGTHLSIGACIIRWIFRILDVTLILGALAVLVIIINGNGQRLGDIAASTTVLKLPKAKDLQSTSWVQVHHTYEPLFYQAELLSDNDIRIIREVLEVAAQKPKQPQTLELLRQTRDAVVKKTSINAEMPDRKFLYTIIKDYNAIHQRMMVDTTTA